MASFEDSKSAAELESEVEMQRGRLSDTIDELQTRLSPGQLLDQVMDMTKFQAGDFAQNMGRSISSNPLPVALVGLGLAWLMSGKSPTGGHGSHAHQPVSPHFDDGYNYGTQHAPYYDRKGGDGLGERVKHAGESLGGKASEFGDKASELGDKAGDALHRAGDAISSARHAAGDQLHAATDEARRRAHEMRDGLGQQAHEIGHQLSHAQATAMQLFRDQPLIAAALAFAAGAAVGAAVPVTAKEREVMGEASGQVTAAVKDAVAPLAEKGKELLDDVTERGREVVNEAMHKGEDVLKEARHAVEDEYAAVKDDVAHKVEEAKGRNKTL